MSICGSPCVNNFPTLISTSWWHTNWHWFNLPIYSLPSLTRVTSAIFVHSWVTLTWGDEDWQYTYRSGFGRSLVFYLGLLRQCSYSLSLPSNLLSRRSRLFWLGWLRQCSYFLGLTLTWGLTIYRSGFARSLSFSSATRRISCLLAELSTEASSRDMGVIALGSTWTSGRLFFLCSGAATGGAWGEIDPIWGTLDSRLGYNVRLKFYVRL